MLFSLAPLASLTLSHRLCRVSSCFSIFRLHSHSLCFSLGCLILSLCHFVITDLVITDLLITDLVITDLVITDLVITDLVITDLVITDLVITDLVVGCLSPPSFPRSTRSSLQPLFRHFPFPSPPLSSFVVRLSFLISRSLPSSHLLRI